MSKLRSRKLEKVKLQIIKMFNSKFKFFDFDVIDKYEYKYLFQIYQFLTITRQLRRKLRMRWLYDVSKVKESSFSKSDLTDPPQIFDAHLLENTY